MSGLSRLVPSGKSGMPQRTGDYSDCSVNLSYQPFRGTLFDGFALAVHPILVGTMFLPARHAVTVPIATGSEFDSNRPLWSFADDLSVLR